MLITIETTLNINPDCEENMNLKEEKFLQEMMTSVFKENPHFIRERKITIRKPFSSETMDVKIEIIDDKSNFTPTREYITCKGSQLLSENQNA